MGQVAVWAFDGGDVDVDIDVDVDVVSLLSFHWLARRGLELCFQAMREHTLEMTFVQRAVS